MKPPTLARTLLLGSLLCAPIAALAGAWIAPDYPGGQAPQQKPVALYWYTVPQTPFVYRTEVTTPARCDRVTALARSSGYLFVWVDGKRAFAYRVPDKQTADPARAHALDLTEALAAPGRHVLAISAPKEGFALDGGFYEGTRRLAPLATDGAWRVAQLPPTTILEDDAALKSGYGGPTVGVKAGETFTAEANALSAAARDGALARAKAAQEDAAWRLGLLVNRGIYLANDEERGWGGPERLDPALRTRARAAEGRAEELGRRIAAAGSGASNAEAESLAVSAARLSADVEGLTQQAWKADEARLASLAGDAITGRPGGKGRAKAGPAWTRALLEKRLGHPLNALNESRYDRLGWLPLPGLSDDQIGNWGIRVSAVTGPVEVDAPGRWLFKTDPQDTGVSELRWSIGYNIENQWGAIDVPRAWQETAEARGYQGLGWYRARVRVPGEWAGNDVELRFGVGGADRLWFNDEEVTKLGQGEGKRVYRIPARLVTFGGENLVAIRVDGKGDRSGIVEKVALSCPALATPESRQAPPVEVLSTPLSPCVILTAGTRELDIHHAPGAKLWRAGQGAPGPVDYNRARDGRLVRNGVLLWLQGAAANATERPVLLVFAANPESIQGEGGLTRILFAKPGERVVAVRPWVKAQPPTDAAAIERQVAFWRRAALAVPVNYAELTRLAEPGESLSGINYKHVPLGPKLEHTLIYDYAETKDAWNTEPLRVAPLPGLCAYAKDAKFGTLEIEGSPETAQDGGLLAPYRVLRDTDRVRYSYRVEPWPRRAGFTSWMFGGADVGLPGNYRELELLAAVGANSYRPQHNFNATDASPAFAGRTRLDVIYDACRRAGINYTNNIDETLNRPREFVRDHYDEFMDAVSAHLTGIASALAKEPFQAVGYDLINEPFDHQHVAYNAAMKRLTTAMRAADPVHLMHIEPCESWGAIQQILNVEPTGDPLTLYSFHDYNFRLNNATDRWPTTERDISSICRMWLPAFQFAALHGVPLHCGEFGDFREPTYQSPAETLLLNDFLRLFDQFGMSHHYYSGRALYTLEPDGSMTPSNVVRTYRRYLARPDFNRYYPATTPAPDPAKYVRPVWNGG